MQGKSQRITTSAPLFLRQVGFGLHEKTADFEWAGKAILTLVDCSLLM